tara:strand:- start:11582 stop:12253 length:672 start_codon:yes stop_codon:yes gene_type:complete
MNKIVRILNLFPGFFIELYHLAKNGSRDLSNKRRFKSAILHNGSSLSSNTILDANSRVLGNSILNNVHLCSYSYVGRNCLVQNADIGKFCSIANDVMIGLGNHPIDYFSTSPLFYKKKSGFNTKIVQNDLKFVEYKQITIENDVWIGARATILDGVTIGNGAIIAAGALVSKDVPAYAIVGGIPAKVIKYRFEKSKIVALLSEKWWDLSLEEIKKRIEELNEL